MPWIEPTGPWWRDLIETHPYEWLPAHPFKGYETAKPGTSSDEFIPYHRTSDAGAFPAPWICPRCNKVNAPHVDQCPCPGITKQKP